MTGMSKEIMKGNSMYNIGTPALAKHVAGDKAIAAKTITNNILGLADCFCIFDIVTCCT